MHQYSHLRPVDRVA